MGGKFVGISDYAIRDMIFLYINNPINTIWKNCSYKIKYTIQIKKRFEKEYAEMLIGWF